MSHPVPYGELTPGLYHALPTELDELLQTGTYVDLTDFRNACVELAVPLRNGAQTFGDVVGYLGNSVKDGALQSELYYAVRWLGGNPNLGVRRELLIGTQCLADMVDRREWNGSTILPKRFTEKNWLIMGTVIRGEVELILKSD